jgi:hypothetical protein
LSRRAASICGLGSLLVIAAAFLLGYRSAPRTAHPNPIRLEHGIPVGALDTPAGALAAADNYLASEDNALLSADQLRAVVRTDWTLRERPVELAQALPSAALGSTPAGLGNARVTAAVAAHRLESYTPQTAQVKMWHEVTVWSSAPVVSQPAQHWTLDALTLVWEAGRWLVASRSPAPDSQTPVPAWTSGGPSDPTIQAFNSRLAGMSAPYYGDTP